MQSYLALVAMHQSHLDDLAANCEAVGSSPLPATLNKLRQLLALGSDYNSPREFGGSVQHPLPLETPSGSQRDQIRSILLQALQELP